MSIFTHKERTEKRLDVNFIAKQARAVIADNRIPGMCTNQLPYDRGQLYTVEEASIIINDIVSDSAYYS